MRSVLLVLCLGLGLCPLFPGDARADPPPRLRPLTGNVGTIERGEQPLSIYLDRMAATLWLETAHGSAGPYVVSIANSLEALDDQQRQGRGERLLLDAYVLLAGHAGPQAGRLAQLYAAGLAQLLQVAPEEAAVTPELQKQLQQIGAYAARAALPLLARLAGAEAAERRLLLGLAQGRYAEAQRHAQAYAGLAPSPISRAYLLSAQLLAGKNAAARELAAIERDEGPAGLLASLYQRRAAREALSARLGTALVPARKAAQPSAAAGDQAVREACLELVKAAAPRQPKRVPECTLLLLEGPGTAWADKELPAAEGRVAPADTPAGRRAALLTLARALGNLLGLPGRPAPRDEAARRHAMDQVLQLLPRLDLPLEDAGAVALLARIAATPQGTPASPRDLGALYGDMDRYLQAHGCAPPAVPLLWGRHAGDLDAERKAIAEVLARCAAQPASARGDEALRLLSLALLSLDARAEAAQAELRALAARHGKEPGAGRYLLARADAEALALLAQRPPAAAQGRAAKPPDLQALQALQRRYEEASAALLPWDGSEPKGRAEAQITTLLVRQHRLSRRPELLETANSHLRYAQLMAADPMLVQALEVYVARELQLAAGKPVAAPTLDLDRQPAGAAKSVLACELALSARAARDSAAYARYARLSAPVPEVTSAGQVRLMPSLGVDERLRLSTRGQPSIVALPHCETK